MKTIKKNSEKKGVRGSITVSKRVDVDVYVSMLPIYMRFKRLYRLSYICVQLMYLIAHRRSITPTGLVKALYGYSDGNIYRNVQFRLDTLKGRGLVESIGGKWRLTDKGIRAISGDDAGND